MGVRPHNWKNICGADGLLCFLFSLYGVSD